VDGAFNLGLAATKLRPPTLPNALVPRARLDEMLDSGVDALARLVLVSAPAGSGKSTLVASWLAGRSEASAWLQAEESDDDPGRFWAYLVEAISAVVPSVRAAVTPAVLASTGDDDMVVSTLITALAESASPLVIVVDDYHLISNDDIHRGMERLVELCPPHVTVVIATRFDPPFRLGRLRVRGHLLEVRGDGLRFLPGEAASLLEVGEGTLDAEEVELLSGKTEGWAAGLVLARLSLAQVSDSSKFVREFHGDDQLVVDYLSDEFLAGVSPDHRQRLLTTSILDQMSGPLVDALCDSADGTTWLHQTASENQLIIGLDRTGEWYRYHHLLRDLLRLEAEARIPDQLPELHRRAAAWFTSEGDHHRAVVHRLNAGDRREATRLMMVLGPQLIASNQIETLRTVLADLGDAAETDAVCTLCWGWCEYIAGEFDSAERWVEMTHRIGAKLDAKRLEEVTPGVTPMAFDPIITAPLRMSILLGRGDVQSALVIARENSDLDRLRSFRLELANIVTVVGGTFMWAGQTDDARAALAVAVAKTQNTDNHSVHLLSLIYQTLMEFDAGDVAAARERATHAIATAEALGLGSYHRLGPAYAVRARTGEGSEAVADAHRAVESAKRSTGDLALAYVLTMCGDVLIDADDPAGPGLLAEARIVVDRCPDPGIAVRYLDRIESRHAVAAAVTETPAIVEQLTDRETAVLRYLPTSLSQRQIAGELFVSPNTVKTHCTAIYRKLAVDNRKAAVQAARELGLL
jgi:LuxR family maltose regulon positive regulatory protein